MSAKTAKLTAMRRAHDHDSETGFILTVLLAHDYRNDNQSFPSMATLMDLTGYGKDLISNRLAWLEAQGIIRCVGRRKAGKGPGVKQWEVPSPGVDLRGIGRVDTLNSRPIEDDANTADIGREYDGNRAAIGRVVNVETRKDLDLDLDDCTTHYVRSGPTDVDPVNEDDSQPTVLELIDPFANDVDAIADVLANIHGYPQGEAFDSLWVLFQDAVDGAARDPAINNPNTYVREAVARFIPADTPERVHGLIHRLHQFANRQEEPT